MARNIVKQSVLEQVYEAIKDDIVSGYFLPGSKLVIRNLKERYNVSDTPIKQSLNRLVSEGLVIVKERRGLWVKEYDKSELQDLFRIRFMLESYCIQTVCKNDEAYRECIEQIEQNLQNHRKLLDSVEDNMTVSAFRVHQHYDKEFHLILLSASRSAYLEKIYRDLQSHTYMSLEYEKRGKRVYENTYSEHKNILNCLKSGKVQKTIDALKEHFEAVCEDIGISFCE